MFGNLIGFGFELVGIAVVITVMFLMLRLIRSMLK
jgi:hypothetical protein